MGLQMAPKSRKFLKLLLTCLLMVNFVGCDEDFEVIEEIVTTYPDAPDVLDFPPGDAPSIKVGAPFDPDGLADCSDATALLTEEACIAFRDTFERDELMAHDIFNWQALALDNRSNVNALDIEIQDGEHLGPMIQGEKAVIMTGRDGGSTHELYMVAKAIDFSEFEQVYIQFRYVPIDLDEQPIVFSKLDNLEQSETIRVDVCTDENDHKCGLIPECNQIEGLRDRSVWKRYPVIQYNDWDAEITQILGNLWDPIAHGDGLNRAGHGGYAAGDWQIAQVLINLSDVEVRKDKFVFKITGVIDEGYRQNNKDNELEDGIIIDDVIVVGLKTSIILEQDL